MLQVFITELALLWNQLMSWQHINFLKRFQTRGALLSFVAALLSLVPFWIWLNNPARPGTLGGFDGTLPDEGGRFNWGGGGGCLGGGGGDLGRDDALEENWTAGTISALSMGSLLPFDLKRKYMLFETYKTRQSKQLRNWFLNDSQKTS